jgi:small-conductance mechanosensitive channel
MSGVKAVAAGQFDDLQVWVRGDGLQILAWLLGSVLASRALAAICDLVIRRIDAGAVQTDLVVASEQEKHRHSLAQILVWCGRVMIFAVTVVRIAALFGLPVTELIAPATVLGVALGFGAQRIVQDLLAGFFIIAERQYGFGDLVRISTLGSTSGVTGTVEQISLRVTRLRSSDGELIIVPNGQLVQVTNLSRDWARAAVDVPLAAGEDLTEATAILRVVCEQAFADPELRKLLLDEPTVMGVESLAVDQVTVRVVARCLPGKQFAVRRALRERIVTALQDRSIAVTPTPEPEPDEAAATADASGSPQRQP